MNGITKYQQLRVAFTLKPIITLFLQSTELHWYRRSVSYIDTIRVYAALVGHKIVAPFFNQVKAERVTTDSLLPFLYRRRLNTPLSTSNQWIDRSWAWYNRWMGLGMDHLKVSRRLIMCMIRRGSVNNGVNGENLLNAESEAIKLFQLQLNSSRGHWSN